jgi:Na+-translocating ferredoxin:NAD+ oxidoreductase RnfG subunit
MKKIMSLAVITAMSLGFSGCVNNNNIVKPQCKIYSLSEYIDNTYDAIKFCESKNLNVYFDRKYIMDKGLSFECLSEKEYKEREDKLRKMMKKTYTK